ncbi:hypothetical protein WDA55_23245, partial [Acinetobacter baumannii]
PPTQPSNKRRLFFSMVHQAQAGLKMRRGDAPRPTDSRSSRRARVEPKSARKKEVFLSLKSLTEVVIRR